MEISQSQKKMRKLSAQRKIPLKNEVGLSPKMTFFGQKNVIVIFLRAPAFFRWDFLKTKSTHRDLSIARVFMVWEPQNDP